MSVTLCYEVVARKPHIHLRMRQSEQMHYEQVRAHAQWYTIDWMRSSTGRTDLICWCANRRLFSRANCIYCSSSQHVWINTRRRLHRAWSYRIHRYSDPQQFQTSTTDRWQHWCKITMISYIGHWCASQTFFNRAKSRNDERRFAVARIKVQTKTVIRGRSRLFAFDGYFV